jgi:hypothetical protein
VQLAAVFFQTQVDALFPASLEKVCMAMTSWKLASHEKTMVKLLGLLEDLALGIILCQNTCVVFPSFSSGAAQSQPNVPQFLQHQWTIQAS